ncbi:hypothetical protein [Methanococcoides sp. FTZ1]|uniref:hypothetical protein n=1 Tax=Methanococcoides sp. FTZ1 TaxID=3439061 RepID=UPI003F841CAA
MKTYLLIWFSSEGASPSEVNKRLLSMGFRPMQGAYDYVYDWDSSVDLDDILGFGDKVQLSLRDTGTMFKIETINGSDA